MKEIKVYPDGGVYIGEMRNGLKNGKGTLYRLTDFFEGYKVCGNWKDDKLEGWAEIKSKHSVESGIFKQGVKNGVFIKERSDGNRTWISYKDGVKFSEQYGGYSFGKSKTKNFGCIDFHNNCYYFGDLYNNRPHGFGMLYKTDENNLFEDMLFCEIYGGEIVKAIDLNTTENINNDLIK